MSFRKHEDLSLRNNGYNQKDVGRNACLLMSRKWEFEHIPGPSNESHVWAHGTHGLLVLNDLCQNMFILKL